MSNKTGIKNLFAVKNGKMNLFMERSVSLHELSVFVRQLATMASAGVPLYQSLAILYDGMPESKLKTTLNTIREKIKSGVTFSQVLSESPEVFPPLMVGLIKVGEVTGMFETSLLKYADLLEWEEEFKSKIVTMLIYPFMMLFIGLAVLIFIITVILPKFVALFADIKQALPLPTLILMNISGFFSAWWWLILICVIAVIVLIKVYSNTEDGRKNLDAFILKVPFIGNAVHKSLISRFAFILSVMTGAGVPLLQALSVVSDTIGNKILKGYVQTASKNVERGESLSKALMEFPFFPKQVIQMIKVGEETGRMDNVLAKVASSYEREMEITTRRLVILLEPIIIVLLSIMVGFVAIAVLLPILSLSTVVK